MHALRERGREDSPEPCLWARSAKTDETWKGTQMGGPAQGLAVMVKAIAWSEGRRGGDVSRCRLKSC
jgi:hypothetical protein